MPSQYSARNLEASIAAESGLPPVLMMSGPRQAGKTALLKHLCTQTNASQPGRRYVTLDNPMLLALARDEPALFLQRFPPPVLIDEIQYAPGLFPLIKETVDADGGKGLVWLTGSQPFYLMKNVGESLAGRVAVMQLQGLSTGEGLGQGKGVRPFLPGNSPVANKVPETAASPLAWVFEMIWRGSFPAMQGDTAANHDLYYASYLQTYLQRDVRDLVAELLKSYWHCGKQAPLYYYRDRDQKEIDVLIVQDGTLYPIEIKKTSQPGRDTVRHFSVPEKLGISIGRGAVICMVNEQLPITVDVDAVPAWQVA